MSAALLPKAQVSQFSLQNLINKSVVIDLLFPITLWVLVYVYFGLRLGLGFRVYRVYRVYRACRIYKNSSVYRAYRGF